MEKQQAPYGIATLILAILSLPLCMCYGFGILLAIVALILGIMGTKAYNQNPEQYINNSNNKIGKIIAIISIILNVIFIGLIIWMISAIGWEVIQSGDQQAIEDALNEHFGVY